MWFIVHAVALVVLVDLTTAYPVHIYVSPTGQDTNNGLDIQHPVETLQRAKMIADQTSSIKKTVYVELLAGLYELPSTLHFDKSKIYEHPVTFRAYRGQNVHVTGGRRIPTNLFQHVTNTTLLNLWTPAARKHIRQVLLPDAGVHDYGQLTKFGFYTHRHAPLEVFINGNPLHLARYPNSRYMDIAAVSNTSATTFSYALNSTRDAKWAGEKEPWAYGFWHWGWQDVAYAITNITPKTHTMTVSGKPSSGFRPGTYTSPDQPYSSQGGYFRVFNLLSELDEPGEYFVDRSTGILYVWPNTHTGTLRSSDTVLVSVLDDCITMETGVSNVVFEDFTLGECRRYGINASSVSNIKLNKMELKNTGSFVFECGPDCRSVSVTRCEIHDGDGGVDIAGGNRNTLESSGNIIEDNHFYDFTRVSAVGMDAIHITGVHGTIRYNHIHDGQYAAIFFEGNDHIMEYNHVHDLCVTTSDCGAFHARRSWSSRGNEIRYNHIHHTLNYVPGSASRAIMLDDFFSSVLIEHNVFYDNMIHVHIGGGRDNIVRYNIMYNATAGTTQMGGKDTNPSFRHLIINMRNEIQRLHYDQGIWKMKYPEMSSLADGHDSQPEGNQLYKNIIWNENGIQTWPSSLKPQFFDEHDNFEVHKLTDFTSPSYQDFTPQCAAKQWADGAKFETPISINDVGPRYTTGPTYLHTALPTYPPAPSPAPCDLSTKTPATTVPGVPYLPDGSGPNHLFPNLTVGCWMIVQSCPKHPDLVGTQRDVEGEKHFHAGTDEDKCLSRAVTRWLECGSDSHYVQTVYGPTGAMTVAGPHCYIAYQACPHRPARAGVHVDVSGEHRMNTSVDEEACLARATDFYKHCGSDSTYPVTVIYGPSGTKRVVGAGCWIKVTSCPADPKLGTFFYDAWGATNVNSDDSQDECYERATYYWQHCGSHREFPVTAYFRPSGRYKTSPSTTNN